MRLWARLFDLPIDPVSLWTEFTAESWLSTFFDQMLITLDWLDAPFRADAICIGVISSHSRRIRSSLLTTTTNLCH
jgi:hypothetical protein